METMTSDAATDEGTAVVPELGHSPHTGAAAPPPRAPEWLRAAVQALERDERLDGIVQSIRSIPLVAPIRDSSFLQGAWLGHALHPLMTDLPLGCWIGAGLVDLFGGRGGRNAAQRLVGAGLLFVPLTAASGVSDWSASEDRRVQRVGVVHWFGNSVVAGAYLMSWRARRRGRHLRGVAWGLAGGGLAWATGYLGGHLSFGLGSGIGPRGGLEQSTTDSARAA
jgi:uncharacterized membrane protein